MANMLGRRTEEREAGLPGIGKESGQKDYAGSSIGGAEGQSGQRLLAGRQDGSWAKMANEELRQAAERFTLGEIDAMISAARASAEAVQGKGTGCGPGPSQAVHANWDEHEQGSTHREEGRSQVAVERARALVAAFLAKGVKQCSLASLGELLKDVLMMIEFFPRCRHRPTTGKRSIFPLTGFRISSDKNPRAFSSVHGRLPQ